MSPTSHRMFTDKEWDEVREGWAANHEAITRILERIRKDYKPGSGKRKKLKAVIEREELEHNLILRVIDKLQELDKILHKDDVKPSAR
jgi:hypothetical protein